MGPEEELQPSVGRWASRSEIFVSMYRGRWRETNTSIECRCGTHKAPDESRGDQWYCLRMWGAAMGGNAVVEFVRGCIPAIEGIISTLVLCLASVS